MASPKPHDWPQVRGVSLDDLNEAVVAGIADLRAHPGYGIAIGSAFEVAGWILFLGLAELGLPFLIYPLAMGFALVAPFAAGAFYAVSDLRERGEPVTPAAVIQGLNRERHRRDLGWMALVTFLALSLARNRRCSHLQGSMKALSETQKRRPVCEASVCQKWCPVIFRPVSQRKAVKIEATPVLAEISGVLSAQNYSKKLMADYHKHIEEKYQ